MTVSSIPGASIIALGEQHACAVVKGALSCWGTNEKGQLGNGSENNADTPTAVTGLSGVSAVSGGGFHTVALASGETKAWGDNQFGELGDGSTNDSDVPVTVG